LQKASGAVMFVRPLPLWERPDRIERCDHEGFLSA
jgi:hypothetical protein